MRKIIVHSRICTSILIIFRYSSDQCLSDPLLGTIVGGLSPRWIRRGSDRIRSDPPTSPPERPPRRTQADSGGPQKSPPSPPESAADPIGSDRIGHQLADGPPENGRKKVKSKSPQRTKQSPLIGGRSPLIGGQSPPRKKSAADKVRHCPPGENIWGQ